jgi:hypothetical protein
MQWTSSFAGQIEWLCCCLSVTVLIVYFSADVSCNLFAVCLCRGFPMHFIFMSKGADVWVGASERRVKEAVTQVRS